jgi:hypothetical protein
MLHHEFILILDFSSETPVHDGVFDRLAAAGCEDAVPCLQDSGQIELRFYREADNLGEAVQRAVNEIMQAVPGVKIIGGHS